jgi:hypothetical protein
VRAKAEQLQHLAEERLERERARRGWVRQLFAAFEADRNRGGGLLAVGVAYRLFLWGLPATLFVVQIFGSTTSGETAGAATHVGLGAPSPRGGAAATERQGGGRAARVRPDDGPVGGAARAFRLRPRSPGDGAVSLRPSSVKSSRRSARRPVQSPRAGTA